MFVDFQHLKCISSEMEYQPKFTLRSFYIAGTSYENHAPFTLKVGAYSYEKFEAYSSH